MTVSPENVMVYSISVQPWQLLAGTLGQLWLHLRKPEKEIRKGLITPEIKR